MCAQRTDGLSFGRMCMATFDFLAFPKEMEHKLRGGRRIEMEGGTKRMKKKRRWIKV